MRLFAYLDDEGQTALGIIQAGSARVVPAFAWSIWAELHAEDDLKDLRSRIEPLRGAAGVEPAKLRPAPAVDNPGKIVCVGLNYGSHVTEGAGREVPDRPLL